MSVCKSLWVVCVNTNLLCANAYACNVGVCVSDRRLSKIIHFSLH